jgi:hypothetical protein
MVYSSGFCWTVHRSKSLVCTLGYSHCKGLKAVKIALRSIGECSFLLSVSIIPRDSSPPSLRPALHHECAALEKLLLLSNNSMMLEVEVR